MKNILRIQLILLLFLLMFIFLVPLSAADENRLTGIIMNCAESVNVRSGPDVTYPTIGTVCAGETVIINHAFFTKGWHQIQFQGRNAYISSDYIFFQKPYGEISSYSETEKYIYLFQSDVTEFTVDNKPAGYRTKKQALTHMVKIQVPVWKRKRNGGKVSSTKVIYVNVLLEDEIQNIFKEIFELPEKFPISTLVGFRWNKEGEVSGPLLESVSCMSAHAYGAAIDINYFENDYYVGKNQDLRDVENPYYISENVREVFERHGWKWGGDFSICTDTMHFQYTGLDTLSYNNGSPFTAFSVQKPYQKSKKVKAIQRRLKKLGYKVNQDGKYTEKTADIVKKFRKEHNLFSEGGTDEDFYILLYNLTPSLVD